MTRHKKMFDARDVETLKRPLHKIVIAKQVAFDRQILSYLRF